MRNKVDSKSEYKKLKGLHMNQEHQDEIQEDTTSMEEKLEELDIPLSECCGAWYTDMRFCSACHEHC